MQLVINIIFLFALILYIVINYKNLTPYLVLFSYHYLYLFWGLVSSIFLSINEVWAVELFTTIGDKSDIFFNSVNYTIVCILILTISLRYANIKNISCKFDGNFLIYIRNLLIAYLLLCYIELFVNGIPLLQGMNRTVYLNNQAGVFIKSFYKYSTILNFIIGVSAGYYKFQRKSYIYLALFISNVLLFILLSNKWSAISNITSFFILGLSMYRLTTLTKILFRNKLAWVIGSVIIGSVIILQTYHFYQIKLVSNELITSHYGHRIFVQQSQLLEDTVNRVINEGSYNILEAWDQVFINPVHKDVSHTSLAYLMLLSLGSYFYEAIEHGSSYTGASPAIYLELGGPYFCFLLFFIYVSVVLKLVKYHINLFNNNYFYSGLFFIFINQPWYLSLSTGKFIHLTSTNYGIKILIFFLILNFEKQYKNHAIHKHNTSPRGI